MIQSRIITTEKVDKTFDGVECLLKRSIIETVKKGNVKRYTIKTERCNYIDVEIPIIDENAELDENGFPLNEPQTETITVLDSINQKDQNSLRVFSFDEINGLYEMIKDQIPSGLSKMDRENIEEKIALLVITQQDQPWGITADKWTLLDD